VTAINAKTAPFLVHELTLFDVAEACVYSSATVSALAQYAVSNGRQQPAARNFAGFRSAHVGSCGSRRRAEASARSCPSCGFTALLGLGARLVRVDQRGLVVSHREKLFDDSVQWSDSQFRFGFASTVLSWGAKFS
jgi:hypothetical protein